MLIVIIRNDFRVHKLYHLFIFHLLEENLNNISLSIIICVFYYIYLLHALIHSLTSIGKMQGILQSQGRVLKKMRFMPSSLTSNSHRLLTALVDSRHKKSTRVKKTVTDIDPEREKEQKEKVRSFIVYTSLGICR